MRECLQQDMGMSGRYGTNKNKENITYSFPRNLTLLVIASGFNEEPAEVGEVGL